MYFITFVVGYPLYTKPSNFDRQKPTEKESMVLLPILIVDPVKKTKKQTYNHLSFYVNPVGL